MVPLFTCSCPSVSFVYNLANCKIKNSRSAVPKLRNTKLCFIILFMTASHQAYPKAEAFLSSPHNVFLKDLFYYCD